MIVRDVRGRERTMRVEGCFVGLPIREFVLYQEDFDALGRATDIELRDWVRKGLACFPPVAQASSFYGPARDNISTDDI
jgi:hypothetical protein